MENCLRRFVFLYNGIDGFDVVRARKRKTNCATVTMTCDMHHFHALLLKVLLSNMK